VTTPTPTPVQLGTFHVQLVSGKLAQVQTDLEQEWFEGTRDAYLAETKFTEATDLRDLDRLLVMELMIFRWTQHLAAGKDYDGDMTDDERLRRNIKEYSDQINKIKESMGLNKKARDGAANEGNFASWLADLKARAKIFGVHREKQLTKALTLLEELSTVLGAFDRSDAEERRKIGFETEADVLDWIRTVALPEYRAVDAYFRAHDQRYWLRDM
jgi:hypothetical protein